jgi:single-strand DNA-binding protein
MSASLNEVTLIGNLGQDPEVRSTQGGKKVATLSVATSDKWTDKQTGEKKERTEWHRVVIFNEHLIPIVEQYVRKGSKVCIKGKLQTRKWTDTNGIERWSTEVTLAAYHGNVVLLDSRQSSFPPPASNPEDYGNTRVVSNVPPHDDPPLPNDLDDEIPF